MKNVNQAALWEVLGFNPVKSLFPLMFCRVCDTQNPFVFLAPKPRSGKPGDAWDCVCFDCADKRLGWIDPRTGGLRPGVSV